LLRDPTFGGNLADGRDDPGDADYWLGQLAKGTDRGTVWGLLNESPEANELRQGMLDLSNTEGNTQSVAERYQTSRANTPLGGQTMADAKANFTGIFQDPNAAPAPAPTPTEAPTSGGGHSGPSLEDIQSMMQEMFSSFSNAWTPHGYGWGGTNSDGVRIN
jgi:hypothetical protein